MEKNYVRFKYISICWRWWLVLVGNPLETRQSVFMECIKKDFWRFLEQIQILLIHERSIPYSRGRVSQVSHGESSKNFTNGEGAIESFPSVTTWCRQKSHTHDFLIFFAQIDLKVIVEFHQSFFFFFTGLQWRIMKGAMTMFVTDWTHLHHPRIGRWKPIDLACGYSMCNGKSPCFLKV